MQKRPIITIVIAMVVLSALSWLFMVLGDHRLVPMPLALVYPVVMTEALGTIASAVALSVVAPMVFVLLGIHLFRGSERIPKRSWVILLVVGLVDTWFLWGSWPYGLKYDGRQVTITALILNASTVASILLVGVRRIKRPSYASNVLFHWLACFWLTLVAFPWLGEKP